MFSGSSKQPEVDKQSICIQLLKTMVGIWSSHQHRYGNVQSLLSENKLIICAFENLHYQISRKIQDQANDSSMVECQARDLEV